MIDDQRQCCGRAVIGIPSAAGFDENSWSVVGLD
jgi:hypothetical protein